MKPTFAKAVFLLVVIYIGSSLFAVVSDVPTPQPKSFRRSLEIEIDRSSEFVRSGEYDKLSNDRRLLFDEMQKRMALLLHSVVEFENSDSK